MKKVFIDVETTGLNDWKNSIHQLAGIIEIDGEIVDTFNYHIQPRREDLEYRFTKAGKDTWETAFSFKNVTIDQVLQNPMTQAEAYESFVSKYLSKHIDKFDKEDKAYFLAYNSPFDNGFVRNFFKQNGDNYFGSWFYSPDICVMRIVADMAMKGALIPRPTSFKQEDIIKQLGLDASGLEAHDASIDVQATYAIYQKVKDGRITSA